MKKLSALMLGAAMVLSTAAFAAAKPENKPATDTSTTAKKVHHKKVKTSKKSVKPAPAATTATPAPTK
ncbi:MAG TPA: hypothetical protein VNY30_11055 [Bryobacteraceae bacterium]|jgi:hypothetical protein|nr:hypothetical protein [Bryobacteraceae bacterium]